MPDLNKKEDAPEDKGGETMLPVYKVTQHRLPIKRVYLYRVIDHHMVLAYKTDRLAPVAYEKMETEEIDTILDEIRNGTLEPVVDGSGWAWKHRNYFVVVYEDPTDSLIPGNAVTFQASVGGTNHTFHDGKDIPVQGKVRRFYCINHMWKKGGGDLGRETEEFTVKIRHGASAEAKKATGLESTLEHTATGTNTGPP